MSAAVQELYAELPTVLAAERSALSGPTVVLSVEPETPVFVLSCGSGLPSEHQRTYGLKVCSQESHERPDYVGQMSGPRLGELLSKEPAGIGVLAGNEEAQDRSSAERRGGPQREDAGATGGTRSAVEEDLGCFAPASQAAYWSKEKEPRPIQEERELLPRPPRAERSGLPLRSLEGSQADVQETAENPPPPSNEAPGREAEGTVQSGKAGESSSPRTSAEESSAPGRSSGSPLKPVSAEDDALVGGHLQGEEDRRGPAACSTCSATTSVLSAAEAGGAALWSPGQGHTLPSQLEEIHVPDSSRSASGLDSSATLDTRLTPTVPEASKGLLQGCLDLRHVLWEEDAGGFEVVCETQGESPLSDCGCSGGTVGCEVIKLLEDWTSQERAGGGLLRVHSREELPSDCDAEQEMGSGTDHSYSRAFEGDVETETGSATRGCREEARANAGAENGQQDLQTCQFAVEENPPPKSNPPFLLDAGRSPPAGPSGHDLKSVALESDGVQRGEHRPLPKDRSWARVREGSSFPRNEASSSLCFWSACRTSPLPLLTCHAPLSWDCTPCRQPLQDVDSPCSQRTGTDTSPGSLQAENSSCPAELHPDEEKPPPAQPTDEHSLAPGRGPVSSPGGLLDSLPEEGPSGTCAELGAEGAGRLQDLGLAAQEGGSRTDGSGESRRCATLGLPDAEERLAEVPAVEHQACSPHDWPRRDPGSAAEAGCTASGSVCLGGRAPKRRTETNAEPVDGLEMGRAPVPALTAVPPQEHNDDSPSCENLCVGLDGAESSSASLCSVWVSSPCPSRAGASESAVKVEGQRVEGDSGMNAEDTVGVDTRVDPPHANLEPIAASSAAGPGGMGTVCSEKDSHRASEQPGGDRCVDRTAPPLELGQLAEDQGKEEPRRVHVSPSPLASELCSLNMALQPSPPDLAQEQGCPSSSLEDSCTEDPWRQREATSQEESQAPVHHHGRLHGPVSWNWEAPEKEALEGPLVVSGWEEGGCAGQAVTHSDKGTQESASCGPNDFLGLKSVDSTLPAPVLVMPNSVQQAFQPNAAGRRSSSETESESVHSPLKPEPVALQSPQPAAEGLECAFEQLQLNSPATEQPDQVDVADFSASRLVQASLSEVQDKGRSPVFSRELASPSKQDSFPPALNPSAVAPGSNLCQEKPLPRPVTPGVQPAQPPGASSLEKAPSTSPPPQVLCCPPAQEHRAPTASLERGGDCRASSSASGSDRGSPPPPEEGTCARSPPGSKEAARSAAGAAMLREIGGATLSPSMKVKPSLGAPPREGSRAAGKTNWPACPFSSPVDSSGPSSQGSRRVAGGEESTVPIRAEAVTRRPLDSAERDTSEEPPSAKGPSKAAVRTRGAEDITGRPRQPPELLPSRSPGALHQAVPRAPLGGGVSEASPKRIRRLWRRWQSTERSRELSGLKPELPVHPVRKGGQAPVESKRRSAAEEFPGPAARALRREAGWGPDLSCGGLGAKTKLAVEHSWRRRLLKARQPLGSSFRGAAVKLPPQQTLATGCVAEGSGSEGTLVALRESQRAQISKVTVELEAGGACLSAANCGRTAMESPAPLAPVSSRGHQAAACGRDGIRRALGGARRTRPSLLFSGPPGRAWGPGQCKAARNSRPVASPACLKHLLEALPQPRSKLVDCVPPAMQAGAPRTARTLLWSQAPKQRACPSRWGAPVGLGQRTKDEAVLRRLSALADALQAPRRSTPPWPSAKPLPATGGCRPRSSQKLPDVLSSLDMTFGCWWTKDGRCFPSMPSSASLALYPLESVGLRGLGHRAPLSVSAQLFPVSFHITVGPVPARSLRGLSSLQGALRQVAMGERGGAWTSSRWTLSFLFSRSCLGVAPVEEGAWTPQSSLSANKDQGKDAVAQRSPGCPLRGLQTLLALASPRGCRLWTRKRTLPRCPPAAQRLTVLQLIQDLKGLKCSSADLLSSTPHSLGRVLSTWSQHGPSEFTPTHSNHCKWPPVPPASTSLGLRNSSAMLPQVPDRILSAPWAVAAAVRLEAPLPPFPASLPVLCSAPDPALLALGPSAPEFPALPLDQLDVPVPVLPKTGTCLEKADSEKRPKKVSQIRIRKTIPKPDPNLTPMGLPRPKRLKKKEFSLEEIYTNQNYKSPPATRCLETIFEEPKERNGSLISVSQQKRKRILEFQDFTVPRKRRVRSRVKVLGGSTRAQKAALRGRELDGLLIQRLTDLEAFLAEEERKEQVAGS